MRRALLLLCGLCVSSTEDQDWRLRKCSGLAEAFGSPPPNESMRPYWSRTNPSFFEPEFWDARSPENCDFPSQFVVAWEISDAMRNLTELLKGSSDFRTELKEAFSSRFPEAEIAWVDYTKYDAGGVCLHKNIDRTHSWDEAFTVLEKDQVWPDPGTNLPGGGPHHFVFAAAQYGSWITWKDPKSKWSRAYLVFTSEPPAHATDDCGDLNDGKSSFPNVWDQDLADELWNSCSQYSNPDVQSIYFDIASQFTNVFVFTLRDTQKDWRVVTRLMDESDRQVQTIDPSGIDIVEKVKLVLDDWKEAECSKTQESRLAASPSDGMSFENATGRAPSSPLPRAFTSQRADLTTLVKYREDRVSRACSPPLEVVFVQEASFSQSDIIATFSNSTFSQIMFDTINLNQPYAKFGVASFQDIPSLFGANASSYASRIDVPLTENHEKFANGYRKIVPGDTGDLRNSQLCAIYQSLYDEGMGWTPLESSEATKLVILVTSTPGHHARDTLIPDNMEQFDGTAPPCENGVYYPEAYTSVALVRDQRAYFASLLIDQDNGAWEDWQWYTAVAMQSRAMIQNVKSDGSDLFEKISIILQLVRTQDCADL